MAPAWLDPKELDLGGLLALALALTAITLAGAYAAAWLWHRFRDKNAG